MTMNQDNQAPGQDDFASGGEEFVFTEEKKPVNRNLLVLLLIAVVGGGMVYFMRLRSQGSSGGDDAATKAKSEQVAEFVKRGDQDMESLKQVLDNMDKKTESMVQDVATTQVPTNKLITNPFQIDKEPDTTITPTKTGTTQTPEPPEASAERAANKAAVSMISFSAKGGSTCIINSKLCSEGSQVILSGVMFKVKQIGQDFVILQSGGSEFRVAPKTGGL